MPFPVLDGVIEVDFERDFDRVLARWQRIRALAAHHNVDRCLVAAMEPRGPLRLEEGIAAHDVPVGRVHLEVEIEDLEKVVDVRAVAARGPQRPAGGQPEPREREGKGRLRRAGPTPF
jgi:hypothetical protein